MTLSAVFSLLLLAAGLSVTARADDSSDALLELSSEDAFDEALLAHDALLVEVYAPWCGTCRMIAPEYKRGAELVRSRSLPVAFAAVNSDKLPELAERLGAVTYPTFIFFRAGASEAFPMLATAEAYAAGVARILGLPGADAMSPAKEYGAGATTMDIASWLFWRGADGGKLATTLVLFAPPLGGCHADPAAAAADSECSTAPPGSAAPTAPGYLTSLALEVAFEHAAGLAMSDPNLRFAIVRETQVMVDFEVPTDRSSIVLYKDHDEGRSEYPGDLSGDVLYSWLKRQAVPLVAHISHKTLQRYRSTVRTLAQVFVDEAQTEHLPTLNRLLASLQSVAYALEADGLVTRGDFTLALTNGKKYSGWMDHYGLPTGITPALVAETTASETLYVMEDGGAEWARTVQCGAEAEAAVGLAGAWAIDLSPLCAAHTRDAATARIAIAVDGEVAAQAEAARIAAGGSPPQEWSDPLPYKPLTVVHIDLDAGRDTILEWLRAVLRGNVKPRKGGDLL